MKLTAFLKQLFATKENPYRNVDISHMDDKTFFTYYLPALKKALEAESVNNESYVKGADWFYPKDKQIVLDVYENKIYNDYPIFDLACGYLDYENKLFADMRYMTKENERKIIEQMKELAEKFDIEI